MIAVTNYVAPLLRVHNLRVQYQDTVAVESCSFQLEVGRAVAVVGESGSGKSTLLKAVMGLGMPNSRVTGKIIFDGQDVLTLPPNKRRQLCGTQMAFIWQNALASFCPLRTVGTQIEESIKAHQPYSSSEIRQQACFFMEKLGLSDEVWRSYPFELSGGMGERVAILAAMMLKPRLLLADEPTSALDSRSQRDVCDALKELCIREKISLMVITHNMAVASFLAEDMLIMEHGCIVEQGTCRQILTHPEKDYTRRLIAAVQNVTDMRV